MDKALAAAIGLVTGGTMAVAISAVWVALQVPARLQERFRVRSSWPMTWAMIAGLVFSAAHDALGFAVALPVWAGGIGIALSGMFVGMLASALGEILQVVPVLRQRFCLEDAQIGYRFALMAGKGIGALLAAVAITM